MRCCSSKFTSGIIETLEEAQDGHVTQGVGGAIKMVGNRKMLLIIAYRVQKLCESVTESVLGFIDVQEATLGATDTVDQVGGLTGESLSDVERLFAALDGGEKGGEGQSLMVCERHWLVNNYFLSLVALGKVMVNCFHKLLQSTCCMMVHIAI
eukprot:g25878.t1